MAMAGVADSAGSVGVAIGVPSDAGRAVVVGCGPGVASRESVQAVIRNGAMAEIRKGAVFMGVLHPSWALSADAYSAAPGVSREDVAGLDR